MICSQEQFSIEGENIIPLRRGDLAPGIYLSTDEIITSQFGGPNLLSFCVARKLRSPTMRLSRALTDIKFLTSKSRGYYFIGTYYSGAIHI
jgi:hypothetical protein